MRVLITTQVFPPEIHPTAVMADELAKGLRERGWEVTVAAGLPHHPTGLLATGYGRRVRTVETNGGYKVVRVWHPTTRRRNILARALVMLTQSFAVFLAGLSSGRPQAVISFGGPPLLGPVLSGILAAVWRAPLLTVIHDVYPDVAVESGAVRNRLVVAVARVMERLQYRLSRKLVVLGGATRAVLTRDKLVPDAKIEVIPVWLDPGEIRPGASNNAWRAEHGIDAAQFVVLYSGTAGIISGAEIMADVASRLPSDVIVVFVGGGKSWADLAARKERGVLPRNLLLLGYQPRARLAEVQASSDLSLLTLLPGRGRTSVPSKLQGYMAAGRPVLASVDHDCDSARLIVDGGFGRVVPPGDPGALAEAILDLRRQPDLREQWGRKAREVFEREHAREKLIDRYANVLSGMVMSRVLRTSTTSRSGQ